MDCAKSFWEPSMSNMSDINELCPSCYAPLNCTITKDEEFTFKVCLHCTMRVIVEPFTKKGSSPGHHYVIAPNQLIPVFKYEVLHPITRMRVLSQRWATLGRINALNALPIDALRKEVKLSEIEDGWLHEEANQDKFEWDSVASSQDDIILSMPLRPDVALT
jgi:hypothetical protein